MCSPTQALCVCVPRQPGRLSGCVPTQGFRCGPQATDWGTHPLGHFGSGAQAPGPLIMARAHLEFQLWVPSPLIWVRAGLQVSAGAAFPAFTVQGLRGEGCQSPRLLRRVLYLVAECLYFLCLFFFFLRNSSYSSPPGPNKHLASHTAQPGSLPRILQQTLHPGRGLQSPCSCAGSRDLIVLKHSSYRQIFQCRLSLVSDLHIWWNTVGCLLCSSDQLGVSLVRRGSAGLLFWGINF